MSTPIHLAVQVGVDLKKLQFQSESYSGSLQWFLLSFFIVVLFGLAVFILYYLRRKKRLEEMSQQREETRVKVLLAEFNLSEKDQELLKLITGSASPGRFIPLLESRSIFEESVTEFFRQNPTHPSLSQIGKMRQRLGYGFSNPRNNFSNTRMLAVGTKLQCKIPQMERDINFLTEIISTTEEFFLVKPPQTQGRPITLKNITMLTFKISRDDDAEYEFTTNVNGQMNDKFKSVIMTHTHDVQKLMFRNAPRISVDMETRFFVVKKEVVESRGHGHFKANESQYAFMGRLRDLSIGGGLMVIPVNDHNPKVGDLVVFQMPLAQINEDLGCEVVRHTPLEGDFLQVHLRFLGMKELNRLKVNRFLKTLEIPEEQEGKKAKGADGAPQTL